jgi:DNA repair photolyase
MNDPYQPLEAARELTRRALQVIADYQFPVHIITKSDLVLRDRDLLRAISRVYAAVSFTITTADDALAKKIEPGAPVSSKRFAAMRALADAGILTGVTMMPILPFIEDTEENIRAIVERARDAGATYIIPAFAMTLRDRQRAYYYRQLDRLFPGLREKYEQQYGERYGCAPPNAKQLERIFRDWCTRFNLATRMPMYASVSAKQPMLI